MTVTIREVTSNTDLKTFIEFPFDLYKGNPYWVPNLQSDDYNTLRKDVNPAFEYCQARYWLAYRDGKVAGRVGAILNDRHKERWNQPYLRFGWIDFIDDPEVSSALMNEVEKWALETGSKAVHGPLGFTDLDREGMLVEGFNELGTLATIYNHAYYPQHLEKLGYSKDIDWNEFEMPVTPEPNEKIARMADISMRRNKLHFAVIKNKKQLMEYAKEVLVLYGEAYKDLYGAVPLTKRQEEAYIKQYFDFLSPKFIPIILDENEKIAAFGIVMPSLSKALQKSKGKLYPFGFIHLLAAFTWNDRADMYLVAVRPDLKGMGVNAIMMDRIHRLFIEMGIKMVETNPELETNADVQSQWKYYVTRQHKRRRVYIKKIGK